MGEGKGGGYGSLVNYLAAGVVAIAMGAQFLRTGLVQYLLFGGLAVVFVGAQLYGVRLSERTATGVRICLAVVGLACVGLLIPLMVVDGLPLCFAFLASIPYFIVGSGRIALLPRALFISCIVSALAVLIDLHAVSSIRRLTLQGEHLAVWFWSVFI